MSQTSRPLRTVHACILALSIMAPAIAFAGQKEAPADAVGIMVKEHQDDRAELELLLKQMDLSIAKVLTFNQMRRPEGKPIDTEVAMRIYAASADLASAGRAQLDETKGRVNTVQLAIIEALRLSPGQNN